MSHTEYMRGISGSRVLTGPLIQTTDKMEVARQMNGSRQTPWAGIALALVTVTLLAWAGLPLLGLLAVAGVWLFSFWADRLRPEPEPPVQRLSERPDLDAIARSAMEATIEAISIPMILTDETRILAANAAAREALGHHLVGQDTRIALRHPDAISLLDQPDGASVVAPALTVSDSLWQLTRHSIDGKYRIIEMRDRTAEADMSRAHTDFVANASHELRTPLSSIIGYVETLTEAEDKVDEALTKRFLGTVLREARRMNHLVVDLMSLSQLEADKHDLPSTQIDLNQLAARVVGEFAPEPGGPVRVELAPSEDARTMAVRGDGKQLEQLLRNFIDNALKYGDGQTPVKVSLAPAPRDMVQLSVRDTGAGIAPEHLPHLTRRFYRTDPGRSRSVGGTGLGLAICKHIVERHRGRLDIASTLGVGTTVSVRLPLVNDTAMARV